jgi:NADPH:quinone reductase-like Zn-dependent oxidoreductase
MKAVAFNKTGSIENLQLIEISEDQKLLPGEVRLQFLAGSLNHLDLWILKGLPRVKYQFPHICGADVCGLIVESKSKTFKVGQRVLVYPAESDATPKSVPENLRESFRIRGESAPGVFRERLVISDNYLMKVPRYLSDPEAASLSLVYLTAWQMIVEKAGLRPNKKFQEPILVHGVGSGVSQALLELLFSFKIHNIGVTSRDPSKLESWKKRGFQTFVNDETLEEKVRAWTLSQRVAIIFDHIGEALFETNIRLLRKNGKFITCGATSGAIAQLDLRHLYFRQLQLLGSTMGSLKHFQDVIAWIAKKGIRPQISKTFYFEEVRKAYELMESSQQIGKIVIVPTESAV